MLVTTFIPDDNRIGVFTSAPAWYDGMWSPIVGCTAVSPGCASCVSATYAAADSGTGRAMDGLGERMADGRGRWTGSVRLAPIDEPSDGRGQALFVVPMSDLFHEDVPDAYRKKMFDLMEIYPQHTYLVLTKRTKAAYNWFRQYQAPASMWLGVSVEDQQRADERISDLLHSRVKHRWLNCEPLLGPIEIENQMIERLDWIAAGAEFGPQARSANAEWFDSLREQCTAAKVPFYLKGMLDGQEHRDRPWIDAAGLKR